MTIYNLKPWTDLVKLHPDVESGNLTEAVFAIDLGAIDENDQNVPIVNRDPEAFFHATYITSDLRQLLEEVLASLAGKEGYNRVLKLRTPFGGGKSHTLASLLHASRSRKALDVIPEAKGLATPKDVRTAVFDGEKFDARNGAELSSGQKIQTMWGWIAYKLGEDAFRLIEGHDKDRVAPGGDLIAKMLAGKPCLILLDEVLKYMERAAAVPVLDSTLQRQSLDFFQSLTVEVARSKNAAMVYSLQWSARESLGNIALLQQIDKLASRVDQLREPVTGDEILPILQRRLLGSLPQQQDADTVSTVYQEVLTNMRRAQAETDTARKQAEEDGVTFRDRLRAAYPFHPALIDLMRERWTAVEGYQRTRGALRFLASCLHSLKHSGGAKALLGPGEIPIKDVDVRVKFIKELGQQNDYDPVITSDIHGPNAKAKKIDDRLGRETPALVSVRPATRIATAILMYSFGGLRREGGTEEDILPPGVNEAELLSACVGPDLDSITAAACLAELRNSCLYLHYDGVRYVFKKDPNVTKLVEDAEQNIGTDETKTRIREILDRKLAGHRAARVWPVKSQDISDEDPSFIIAYLPLEFAEEKSANQEKLAKELFEKYGDKPRRYRNGLGLAIPHRNHIEALRRAVRYLLATERVESKKQQLRLTKDQLDQLKERRRTEETAIESAFRQLYSSVWLPRVQDSVLEIEKIEIGGRPLQATGIHERIMELLTIAYQKVFTKITPRKIVDLLKLGETGRLGIKTIDVQDAFYGFLGYTRLDTNTALRKAIATGVKEKVFGYFSGSVPPMGSDNKFQVNRDKVMFDRMISEDEVDMESGFLMMPEAIPLAPAPIPVPLPGGGTQPSTGTETEPTPPPQPINPAKVTNVRFSFEATRGQLFKVWNAIANLADKTGKVQVQVNAQSDEGFDQTWLRNAVHEPFEEADIKIEEEEK